MPAGFDREESHDMDIHADRLNETLADRLTAVVRAASTSVRRTACCGTPLILAGSRAS